MTTEQLQAEFNRIISLAESGELTQGDMLRLVVAIGPKVDEICREFGDSSDRCSNMKTALSQMQAMIPSLPQDSPSRFGVGAMVGAGLVGLLLGGVFVYAMRS